MNECIQAVLRMSLSGAALTVLLLALRPILRNRIPAAGQYALWLVALLAFLVPLSSFAGVPATTPVAPIASVTNNITDLYMAAVMPDKSPAVTVADGTETIINTQAQTNVTVIPAQLLSTAEVVGMLYIAGVLAVMLYYVISYTVFTRRCAANNRLPDDETLAALQALCMGQKAPRLFRNPLAATPMLLGLFRPTILLPERDFAPEQLQAVFAHELTHLHRRDVLIKWLSVMACAVHWFNPLSWLAARAVDRACELSCDEAVIRGMDAEGKQSYGDTLITIAAAVNKPRAVLATTMYDEKKALRERLNAIMHSKKPSRLAVVASAVMVVLSGCGAFSLGAGQAVQEPATQTNQAEQASASSTALVNTQSKGNLDDLAFETIRLNEKPSTNFVLAYESEDSIYFYGSAGFFGYDLTTRRIFLHMDYAKTFGKHTVAIGAYNVEVSVSKDGKTVVLHNNNTQEAYYIDIPSLTYKYGAYTPLEEPFASKSTAGRLATTDMVGTANYTRGGEEYRMFSTCPSGCKCPPGLCDDSCTGVCTGACCESPYTHITVPDAAVQAIRLFDAEGRTITAFDGRYYLDGQTTVLVYLTGEAESVTLYAAQATSITAEAVGTMYPAGKREVSFIWTVPERFDGHIWVELQSEDAVISSLDDERFAITGYYQKPTLISSVESQMIEQVRSMFHAVFPPADGYYYSYSLIDTAINNEQVTTYITCIVKEEEIVQSTPLFDVYDEANHHLKATATVGADGRIVPGSVVVYENSAPKRPWVYDKPLADVLAAMETARQ